MTYGERIEIKGHADILVNVDEGENLIDVEGLGTLSIEETAKLISALSQAIAVAVLSN